MPLPSPLQVLGAQQHQVCRHHHRDATWLLPKEAPWWHVGLRLHPAGDWSPECVRGRGPWHKQVSTVVNLDLRWHILCGNLVFKHYTSGSVYAVVWIVPSWFSFFFFFTSRLSQFYSLVLLTFVLQRPHGASRVRVLSPFQGRRLQSGGPHDARSTQRWHGEGHRAVYSK